MQQVKGWTPFFWSVIAGQPVPGDLEMHAQKKTWCVSLNGLQVITYDIWTPNIKIITAKRALDGRNWFKCSATGGTARGSSESYQPEWAKCVKVTLHPLSHVELKESSDFSDPWRLRALLSSAVVPCYKSVLCYPACTDKEAKCRLLHTTNGNKHFFFSVSVFTHPVLSHPLSSLYALIHLKCRVSFTFEFLCSQPFFYA